MHGSYGNSLQSCNCEDSVNDWIHQYFIKGYLGISTVSRCEYVWKSQGKTKSKFVVFQDEEHCKVEELIRHLDFSPQNPQVIISHKLKFESTKKTMDNRIMLPNILIVGSQVKTSPRLMKRGQGEEVKMAMKFNLIFFWRIGRDCIHPSGSKPSPKLRMVAWNFQIPFVLEVSDEVPPLNLIIWGSVTSGLFSGNWRDPNLLAPKTSFRISWICNHRVFFATPWPTWIPRNIVGSHLPFQPLVRCVWVTWTLTIPKRSSRIGQVYMGVSKNRENPQTGWWK